MRAYLQQARIDKGMTQQQVADELEISIGYYQKLEQGTRTGDVTLWDKLEDLFGIHQRTLREIYHAQEDSRQKH